MQTRDRSDVSGLPSPLDTLARSFDPAERFTNGAAKLAQFLARPPEHFGAAALLDLILSSEIPSKWQEFVLFCLFDTGYADIDAAQQVLRLSCLRRLYLRLQAGGRFSEYERRIALLLKTKVQIDDVANLVACGSFARKVTAVMFRGGFVPDADRKLVVLLLRSEAAACRARIMRLSRMLNPENQGELARRLPVLHMFTENVRIATDLGTRIWRGASLGTTRMTLERALGPDGFDILLGAIGDRPALRDLHDSLSLQRRKLVATQSLVALSTLSRWVLEGQNTPGRPLLWIHSALNLYNGGRFAVDAGVAAPRIRRAVEHAGAQVDFTAVRGSFGTRLFTQWIGPDLLTRPMPLLVGSSSTPRPHHPVQIAPPPEENPEKIIAEGEETEEDIRDIIRLHLNNDALIGHLLAKPNVFNRPGLVQFIAARSRSIVLLTRIASQSELHSGSANRNVPKALLCNPMPIPIGLLRRFLRPGFFTARELKALISTAGTMRGQVVSEVRLALESSF